MNKYKILIIEDEIINVLNMQRILEKKGYEICGIGITAEEAIEMAEKLNPDLILMDIVLAGDMDGIFAVEEIKKKYDIPIVYCTANTDNKTFARAKETDPHGYIIKPLSKNDLLFAIKIALYKHDMERKLWKEKQKQLKAQNISEMEFMKRNIISKNKYFLDEM